MKITRLSEDKEIKITDDYMTLSCPICNALWLKDEGGDYDHGTCKHLRFVWWTGAASADAPEYFGKWDTKAFTKQCLLEINRKSKEDGDEENYTKIPAISDSDFVREVLERISSSDVDEVWEYVFFDEYCMGGGNDASAFYGIKNNP